MNELNCSPGGIALSRPDLLRYPINMFPFLPSPWDTPDALEVLSTMDPAEGIAQHHPAHIAQFALALWNMYITNGREEYREEFRTLALWLLAHEARFADGTGGWLLPATPHTASRPALSALAQGSGISVLVRAYQLTGDDTFLQAARRVMQTFERDILDGGINTPIGDDGIFFEEIATYPASHALRGHLFALFGLYDYMQITGGSKVEPLLQCGLTTLHLVIDAFDSGYWTYSDLLHKPLASTLDHALHVQLLAALATYTHCGEYATVAKRWDMYQQRFAFRLRYLISGFLPMKRGRGGTGSLPYLRHRDHEMRNHGERICIPITAFPIPGGMKSVLAGVVQAMGDKWQITYLTNHQGKGAEQLEVKGFGWGKITSQWQFPNVWLYCITGGWKLFRLMRNGPGFSLLLPQDGLFSAAFAGLVGKLMGAHIVCMDHGSITHLDNITFQSERREAMQDLSRLQQLLSYVRFAAYWPSLRLLARLATPWIDHFLIAGEEVEEVYCKQLGVHPYRITRYVYIVDPERFTPPAEEVRGKMRVDRHIPADAIVITLINRLAPEKGLSFALEGIALMIAELPQATRARVKVLIAGDGPLRTQVEADIVRYSLDSVCMLWGEADPTDVTMLLGLSDIFLYSGTRGTNYSMAVLEAMAAACAVVASISPRSNARLLAEGRGIAIMPANAREIGNALALLCNDQALCRRMGLAAREYVATHHNIETLQRTLLRVSHFSPSLHERWK